MKILSSLTNQLLKALPNRKLKLMLLERPPLIIYPEKRLVLLWSAKAGSAFIMKWIFTQMDIIDQAYNHHNWIHRYRTDIYYRSRLFKIGFKLFMNDPDSFDTIKIVDNPFKRAVRSYIHACINGYEDTKISSFLHREIKSGNRFSFREFSHYLSSVDITKSQVHHKNQVSELERKDFVENIHIVKLENSMEEIPRLEKLLGLKNIDLLPLRKSDHHRPKYETSEFMGDVVMNEIFGIRQPTIPEYKQFYDDDIIEIISDVYREDFERYNYEIKLDLGR